MKQRMAVLFLVGAVAGGAASAAMQTWTGSGATPEWTNTANWAVAAPASGDDVLFNSSSVANLATVLGTNFSLNALAVVDPAGGISLASDANTNVLTVGAGGLDLSAALQDLTFSARLTLGATQAWNVATGRTIHANGSIAGSGVLTKTGPGLLILNAANSFSSGLVVSNGTVQLRGDQAANRLAANCPVRIETNGVVDYYAVNATATANHPVYTVNPGGILLMGQAQHVHLGTVNLNGGRIASLNPGSKYNSEDYQMDGTTTVGGTQPSLITLDFGCAPNGTQTFNVADVTGDSAADLTLNGPAVGGVLQNRDGGVNSGFIKTGAGTMLIDAATTFSGPMTISGGTVKLGANGTLPAASVVTVGANAVFDVLDTPAASFVCTNKTLLGSGTVSGSVELAGASVIGGGGAGSAGTLTVSGALTLSGAATNIVDIGGGLNDRIAAGTALVLNGDTIAVNATQPLTNGTYTILTYPAGLKAGSFSAAVINTTRKTITVDETPVDRIDLVVSGGGGAALRWNSTNSTAWDIGVSTNWYNLGATAEDVFLQGDDVLFDDTTGVTTTVNFAAATAPSSLTVDASTNNFSLGGAGHLSGPMGVVKSGTSTLALGGTGNDFTGPVVVSSGTFRAGSATALGAAGAGTTIGSGATLDVNGQNLGQETVNISGDGIDGYGAIVNGGAQQLNALQYVNLLGDARIGGNNNNRWDVRTGTAPYVNLNGYTLTKVGSNYVAFVGAAVTNSGDIAVNGGILSLEAGSPTRGAGSIFVNPGGTLQYWNTVGLITKDTVLNGGTLLCGAVSTIGSPILINTGSVINAGANLTLTNPISGSAGFTKAGGAALILPVANTFAGGIVLSAGTVNINSDASLGAVPGAPATNLTVAGGGTLQAAANGITVNPNRTLSITAGTFSVDPQTNVFVIGGAISGAGSVAKPGAGQVTLTGGATLGGSFSATAGRLVFDGGAFTSTIVTNNRSLSLQGGATAIVTNGAQLHFNGTIVLGTGGSGNSGHLIQHGGSIVVKGNEGPTVGFRALQVGEYPNESSTYTMLGGFLEVTNGTLYLPWQATQGIWSVSSATALVKKIQVASGVGILNLESGLISIGSDGIQGGNAIVNLGGGTIGAYASWNSTLAMRLTGTNGPTTFDSGANTITLGGTLTGTGGLVKAGAGTLALTATNQTFTGGGTVNGGLLALNGSAASAFTVNNGGALRVGSATAYAGTLELPSLALNSGATIQLPVNVTRPVLRVAGTDVFTTAATNQVMLVGNISTGTFPVIDYEGNVQGAGVAGLVLLPVTPRGSASLVDNVASTTVDVVVSDLGSPIRWKGTVDNQWNIDTTTNWETTVGVTPTTYLQNPNGDLVLFDDAASLFSVSIPANVSPTFMTVSNEANDYAFGGAAIGGANGITKYGTGRLTLGNTNVFSGTVAVNGGALAIVADASLGAAPGAATPQLVLGGGARLVALSSFAMSANRTTLLGPAGSAGTATIDTGANTLTTPQLITDNTGGMGTLVKTGSGTQLVSNINNSYSGGTVINEGTIQITTQGNGALGKHALSGGKPITINTGAVLRLAAADALGYFSANPNPMTINGGTMTIVSNNFHASVGNFGFILNSGTITSEGPGSATGNYIFDGAVTTLSNASPSVINPVKIYMRVNPMNFNVAAGGGATDLLVSAQLTGGNVAKNGEGIMVMTGSNVYTGGTAVNGGTLSVDLIADSVESRIGTAAGANNYLALKDGTLRFTGANTTNATTRYLWVDQGAGTFDITGANSALVLSPAGGSVIRDVTKAGAGTLVLNGVLGGTGSVTVAGGTLVLNAVNTRTGPAYVTNGTLLVQGSVAGAVTVGADGTLGGTGTVAGAVVNGGSAAPGASAGTLTLSSDYTQQTGGALDIEIGGTSQGVDYDFLNVGGTAALDGALNVSFVSGYTGMVGDVFVILNAGTALSGTFATTNLATPPAGGAWDVQYVGNFVMLSINSAAPPAGYDVFAGQIPNAADRGYQNDPDGDGYANLLEYVTGGDPTNADTRARMSSARTNGVLALQFSRSIAATDATLYVEASFATTNDATWTGIATNLAGSWGAAPNVSETGGPDPVDVTVADTDPAATNRFLRLRVTRP